MTARMWRHHRPGKGLTSVLLIIVALAMGVGGGYWLAKQSATVHSTTGPSSDAASVASASAADEQWYTCGMHPNVLQKGPGDCPICHMKLTPLKKQDGGGGDAKAGGATERKILYWRSSMAPDFISDKPGKDSMGMDLVPVYADEADTASVHAIRIDPVTIQNMGIRTAVISRGPLVKTIRTVGRVDYDEQLVTFVNTKFSGWIEKLHVDETGQHVDKGQALFDVYSPELYAAQEEYLAADRNLPRMEGSSLAAAREDAVKLVDAAATKLKYLDVSDEQVARIRESGRVEKTVTINSPATGIATEKMVLEGMYVQPGTRLYTIADLSRVWVYVDVYEYQLPWIRVGQEATITLPYVAGRQFEGTVVYIYPYLEQQTRVIKVRLEFDNPAYELKPGMYANVRLASELQRDALLVPREAYIDSGTRQVAFVDLGNGKFEPRELQVGVEAADGMVEVLYGLDEGEVVVTSGQFMFDGESKLKEAVAKMMEAERAKTTKRTPEMGSAAESAGAHARGAGGHARGAGGHAATIPPEAKYACPMDAHPDQEDTAEQGAYFSAGPGRCPWCGMELKPLEELDWVQVERAAQGANVAYTCPDHPHVFSESSGDCPRCGRKMMPFREMYTCPNIEHAGVISTVAGNCPHCGRGLAAYRGVWLDESMAERNLPPIPAIAELAPYRCSVHPLVHSEHPGQCTICGLPLTGAQLIEAETAFPQIPPGAQYTCPMKECWQFAAEPGECSVCGMKLKPIEQVPWAKEILATETSKAGDRQYVCPMHPDDARSDRPGTCPICAMQLVDESAMKRPRAAPEHVAAQMDYIMEHYLELWTRLAADKTGDVARHALGLVAASEELAKHLKDPGVNLPAEVSLATDNLHAAALKITGERLTEDRVTFVALSAAVRTLVEHARPDRTRWPKLYIYHCPMSKGDWIQSAQEKRNPYYGFKMLTCGELKDVR